MSPWVKFILLGGNWLIAFVFVVGLIYLDIFIEKFFKR